MPLLAPVRKSVAEPENIFYEEKYIFMDCFTVERLMIPLNIRHHTFHVHRAVKTETKDAVKLENTQYTLYCPPTLLCLLH